jgi:kinesin family protein 5
MNSRETKNNEQCCLQFTGHNNIEVIDAFFTGQKEADALKNTGSFTFDKVFDQDSTQLEVFDEIGRDLVSSVVDGINSTLFVYGQTASGKTFTMQGPDITNDKMKGLIPRIIEYQFEKIDNSLETVEFTLNVSIFEIYMERIRDLLNIGQKDLKIREDVVKGVFVENLTRVNVGELSEVMKLMMEANKNRIVASTKMNEQSSRSHLLFQLEVHQKNTEDQSV